MPHRSLTDPVLEVHDLTISYHKKPVLWSIDLKLPEAVICGIIGPNGAGKSTLLKAIMGLTNRDSGYVRIFGQALETVRKKVSYVPQRESVDWDFPATVLDVVMMGTYSSLGLFRNPGKKEKEIAINALKKVGMENYVNRQIAQLSGGQQQRVFLARALAQNADIYFLDEPFAGVDIATEAAIIDILRDMRAQNKTIVVVHHDLQTAASYFDWMILLNMRLVACGQTTEIFTSELLQQTYGGRLTVLDKLSLQVSQKEFPIRETNM